MHITKTLSILLILIFLTGCSIEKRYYSHGFNFNWGSNNNSSDPVNKQKGEIRGTAKNDSKNQISTVQKTADYSLTTSSDENIQQLYVNYDEHHLLETGSSNQDSCDVITLKNNTTIKAKVIKITTDDIIFKKCDDLKGSDQVIPKAEISEINYSNGEKEWYGEKNVNEKTLDSSGNKIPGTLEPIEFPLVNDSIIAGALSFIPVVGWIFGILAVVFGSISLKKIRENPDRFKGEKRASTGLTLGIIGLVLGMIAVIASYLYL